MHKESEGAALCCWRLCLRLVERRHGTCGDLTRPGGLKMRGSCGFHCNCISLSCFRHPDQRSSPSQRPTADPSVLYHSLKFHTQTHRAPKTVFVQVWTTNPKKILPTEKFPFYLKCHIVLTLLGVFLAVLVLRFSFFPPNKDNVQNRFSLNE